VSLDRVRVIIEGKHQRVDRVYIEGYPGKSYPTPPPAAQHFVPWSVLYHSTVSWSMSLMDSKVKKGQPESAYTVRVAMSPPRLIAPENGVEGVEDATSEGGMCRQRAN
jgi:hypothetical protein